MNWKTVVDAFSTALAEALKDVTDKGERRKVLDEATNALPKEAQTHLSNRGFAASYSEHKDDEEAWKKERKRLEAENADLKRKTEDLRKKTPDIEGVRTDYETKLSNADTKHKEDIAALEAEFGETEKQRFQEKVQSVLTSEHHVDPLIAESAIEKAVNGRLKVKKREVKLYQSDGATPVVPPTDKTLPEVLAEEILPSIDKRYITSTVGTGSGVTTGAGAKGKTKSDAELTDEKRASGRYRI